MWTVNPDLMRTRIPPIFLSLSKLQSIFNNKLTQHEIMYYLRAEIKETILNDKCLAGIWCWRENSWQLDIKIFCLTSGKYSVTLNSTSNLCWSYVTLAFGDISDSVMVVVLGCGHSLWRNVCCVGRQWAYWSSVVCVGSAMSGVVSQAANTMMSSSHHPARTAHSTFWCNIIRHHCLSPKQWINS